MNAAWALAVLGTLTLIFGLGALWLASEELHRNQRLIDLIDARLRPEPPADMTAPESIDAESAHYYESLRSTHRPHILRDERDGVNNG